MKNYKIIKEKKEVTDSDIDKYKSFSQLSQSYQRHTKRPRVPLYKNKWSFIALVIIILLLLLMLGEL